MNLNLLLVFFVLICIWGVLRFNLTGYILLAGWSWSNFTMLWHICLLDTWQNLIFLRNSCLYWYLLCFDWLNYLLFNLDRHNLFFSQRCILIDVWLGVIFQYLLDFGLILNLLGLICLGGIICMWLNNSRVFLFLVSWFNWAWHVVILFSLFFIFFGTERLI